MVKPYNQSYSVESRAQRNCTVIDVAIPSTLLIRHDFVADVVI